MLPIKIRFFRSFLVILLSLFFLNSLYSQTSLPIPPESEILKTLRKEHPRIWAVSGEEDRVNKLIESNDLAASTFQRILKRGESIFKSEPVEYVISQRSMPTLKPISGSAQERIVTLATLYRLTKDKKYFDRCILEMNAVCQFPDWNHRCFLDTSLLTVAIAVGYDWLYHELSPEQRLLFKNSIRDKGLLPGKEAYEKNLGWTRSIYNWNQACAGGLTVGALAIADEEPELAAFIVNRAATGVQKAMTEFDPDGGTREGPGYWGFAVQYNIYLIASLDSALGTDFGLSGLSGFADTGRFRMHFVTPMKTVFTNGDTQASTGGSWTMHWLSKKFDRPSYAWQDRTLFLPSTPLHLWFLISEGNAGQENTAAHFTKAGLVFMRSSWKNDAVYVAFKGGTNAAGHSHLELGHFQLNADDRLWIGDLGSPKHYTSDYFKKDLRWTYYQASSLSHNIPHIDQKIQNPKGIAAVTTFESTPERTRAEIDLSDAYKGQVASAKRRITLENRTVTVDDRFEGVQGETFTWQVHAPVRSAVIDEKNPRLVKMQHHYKRMHLEIVEPKDAVFEFEPIIVPEGQEKPPENSKRIVIRRRVDDKPILVTVRFEPQPALTPKK